MPALILASASSSRRQLLSNAGLVFDIEPSGIDEEEIFEASLTLVLDGLRRRLEQR